MKNSIAKILFVRLISSLIILFLLISSIFILLRIAPGDPVQKFISPELSAELAGRVRESFQLNGSVSDQYRSFVKNLVLGDFGISYTYRTPVLIVIQDYLLFTLVFATLSFSVQIITSYHLALIAFKKRGGFLDKAFSGISLVIYSVPAFIIAIVLIYIFSVKLQLLPSSDLKSINYEELTFPEKILDYFKHLILPVLTLSLGGIVIFYKYLRDNLDSVSRKSFVTYLHAMGMNDKEILKKHIIPNSLGPLISVAGVRLGILLSGSLITEVIFGLPGMGRLTVNAILLRDYPLVIGCAFVAGVIIIISNLFADLLKVKIDKRLVHEILN